MYDEDIEKEQPFLPDWVSAPGETIADIMKERQISQENLAQGLSINPECVRELLAGRVIIDEVLAHRLATFLGSSKEFWLKREQNYRLGCIRLGKSPFA